MPEVIEGQVTVISRLAEPDHHLIRARANLRHVLRWVSIFVFIGLVDPDSIYLCDTFEESISKTRESRA